MFWYLLAVLLSALAFGAFLQSGSFWKSLCFSAFTGNLALLGVAYAGAFTGVFLVPNLFTVGTATLFGIPGVLSLLIIRLFF